MSDISIESIAKIKDFASLLGFLREELGWPLEDEDIEELFFDYEPDELGIKPEMAVKIREIRMLRPFSADQPWGIFHLRFEPKRLPVVVLRRVLQALVVKKRQRADSPNLPTWECHDLLFVSSYGETDRRAITFAHFREDGQGDLPALRVIGWDAQDTPLHMEQCVRELGKLSFDPALSPDEWRKQWASAFVLEHRQAISTSKALAEELARLAAQIRRRVNAVLGVESKQGAMRKLYKAIHETLLRDIDEDRFADMFAQTMAYGLFSARCSRKSGALVADNLTDMIPESNLFLRELLSTFFSLGGRKGKIDFDELGINDVVGMLRQADMDAVLADFGDRNPSEDPVIHFYEGFLKQYDANQRIRRGAFYTPRPVVSFIVRSVHEILRKDFGLEYGLADTTTWGEFVRRNRDVGIPEGVSENEPFVQILDPATGTGTFLVEIIDLIHKTMIAKWEDENEDIEERWNEYVPKHLLPRVFGFELMMAPYSIAHMKVALKLVETGYVFKSDETIRIHLTNSLEEAKDTLPDYLKNFSPALAHEAHEANRVKKEAPITVVIGNPPYSVISTNKGEWIGKLINDYKYVDGKHFNERKHSLNDDYVKFVRYGEQFMEKNGKGLLAFINNHSFLDNPTFRGMRWHLLKTFDKIYLFDLHGNSKKETYSDMALDKNVFDIRTGVSVNIFVRTDNKKLTEVRHADIWGKRESKYDYLAKNTIETARCAIIRPEKPYLFFVPKDVDTEDSYFQGISTEDIFCLYTMGFASSKDELTISFDKEDIWRTVTDFKRLDIEQIKLNYGLHKDSRDWSVKTAKNDIKNNYDQRFIRDVSYRPFDERLTYYTGNSRGFYASPQRRIMSHLGRMENLAFCSCRMNRDFSHTYWIARNIVSKSLISSLDNNYVFPLYLYPESEGQQSLDDKQERQPNLNLKFIQKIAEGIGLVFTPEKEDRKSTFAPIDLLGYIYAVLHSPSYRERYKEFLKIDFPRIPFTSSPDLFLRLSELGGQLISLHLLESDKLDRPITTFPVSGDNAVTQVGEAKKRLKNVKHGKGRLYINKTQYFDGLPEAVWNFHIGGYQVCHKWLYDRKKAKRTLSEADVAHYHRIVVALKETMGLMEKIDESIGAHGGWPIR